MFMPTREIWVPRRRFTRWEEAFLDELPAAEHARILAMRPFAPGLMLGAAFVGFFAPYTARGSTTVPIPAGATFVTAECIAGGMAAQRGGGGAGGMYAKRTAYPVAGLPSLTVYVGDVGQNTSVTSGSTTLANAQPGTATSTAALANSGTGDLINVGGNGGSGNATGNNSGGGAGGSAGPGGNGVSNSTGTASPGGAGGGGSAGAGASALGGTNFVAATPYGAGGAANNTTLSPATSGWVGLAWR